MDHLRRRCLRVEVAPLQGLSTRRRQISIQRRRPFRFTHLQRGPAMDELSALRDGICDFCPTLCAFWGGLCGDTVMDGQNTLLCDIIETDSGNVM